MKKSLIALAVLATTGAAMAQSSVTLSGRVDGFLGSKTEGIGDTENTVNGLSNGGLSGSRWALSGTEDLGGGLKAMFKLENRFSIDSGAQNTNGTDTGFLGDAYVGLNGGFGTVKLGRTYTAFDDARSVSNSSNVFDSTFTPSVGGISGINNKGIDYISRGKNGIRYESPSFGGFSGAVSYSFGENNIKNVDDDNIVSMHVKYAAGPVVAAYGYQQENVAGNNDNKYHQLSAAYDFGMASISGGLTKRNGTNATGDDRGINLGVNVPVGAALNVSAGIAREDSEIGGNTVARSAGFGVGATYSLSKRTITYVGYKQDKIENGSGTETGKTRVYGVGVRHTF